MSRVLWDFGDGHPAVRRQPDRTQHGPGRSPGASPPVHVLCSRSASATPNGAHPDQPGSLFEVAGAAGRRVDVPWLAPAGRSWGNDHVGGRLDRDAQLIWAALICC
jgi:hypothetical protein